MTPTCTTIVALDDDHLPELAAVWPTWVKFRPEILQQPLLLMCDEYTAPGNLWWTQITDWWREQLQFVWQDHPKARIAFWGQPHVTPDGLPQRERALTALVFGTAHVRTPWYLKLDTDVVATSPGKWIDDSWFAGNPVFVTSPWGYTKPANAIQALDDWGDTTPGVREHPRLNLPFDPASRLVRHKRIISYVFFGRTDWTQKMASLAGDRLPVPSQDTFLWYCAKRRGDMYRTRNMKTFGWRHINGLQRLREAADRALSGA